jgi:hypothetical protein
MNKARIRYVEQEDVLHLLITDEPESRSVELSPNITVELNDRNEMIGARSSTRAIFCATLCWIRFRRKRCN